MKKISFTKMSGAGNDFIIFRSDDLNGAVLSNNAVKSLCHRRNGIGSDGLIIIHSSVKADFQMDYYNADGSLGSLCGNGARCAISFAYQNGYSHSNHLRFANNGLEYSGEVLDTGEVRFHLNPPKDFRMNFDLKVKDETVKASFINTGSPHVIIEVQSLDDYPVFEYGKIIRYDKSFPGGTNVNFIKIADEKIYIRTYERGVEDETLACGTGSAAAALSAYLNEKLSPPIKLITYGGEELKVDFNQNGSNIFNLNLTGPAKTIYTGLVDIEKIF